MWFRKNAFQGFRQFFLHCLWAKPGFPFTPRGGRRTLHFDPLILNTYPIILALFLLLFIHNLCLNDIFLLYLRFGCSLLPLLLRFFVDDLADLLRGSA